MSPTRTRCTRLAAVIALTTAAAAIATGSQPASARQPLTVTGGYYVATADWDQASQLGCDQAGSSGRVSLYFGEPRMVAGAFGASLWGAPDQTLHQIEEWVKWFIIGYARCRAAGDFMYVGVGTSNSGIDSDGWIREHGMHWSMSVESLDTWATAHYASAARVRGAYDAQPSWASYEQTHRWMQGYGDNPGWRYLFYSGSADGCPQTEPQALAANGACDNGWTQADLWHLTAGHQISLTIPQIDAASGASAAQWGQISEYGYRYQDRSTMYFSGVTTDISWFTGF
jgi:hypothetical protein